MRECRFSLLLCRRVAVAERSLREGEKRREDCENAKEKALRSANEKAKATKALAIKAVEDEVRGG